MKKRTQSLLSDLAFQALLVFMSAGIIFLSIDSRNLVTNGILLCITVAILMVVYFTSLKAGLILDIIFIMLWIAYIIFRAFTTGMRITANVYFWMLWPLLMLLSVAAFVKQQRVLDEENKEMNLQLRKFVTIDELTQLNNLLAFERDSRVYMNISRRYHMDLVLALWHLTYQEDLESLLGKEKLGEAIGYISDSIKNSLRGEDLVYLVEKEPYIWGTLLFSNPESAEVVIQHVKEGTAKTDLSGYAEQIRIPLELTVAIITYDGGICTPLSFLAKAKSCLQERNDEEDVLAGNEDLDILDSEPEETVMKEEDDKSAEIIRENIQNQKVEFGLEFAAEVIQQEEPEKETAGVGAGRGEETEYENKTVKSIRQEIPEVGIKSGVKNTDQREESGIERLRRMHREKQMKEELNR